MKLRKDQLDTLLDYLTEFIEANHEKEETGNEANLERKKTALINYMIIEGWVEE